MRINAALGAKCPGFIALIDLILSIPSTSAEAERGFSQMKVIKSDWRSRLRDTALSDLMLVLLETSAKLKDFDPTEAMYLWLHGGSRSRRPEYLEHAHSAQSQMDTDGTQESEYSDTDHHGMMQDCLDDESGINWDDLETETSKKLEDLEICSESD